MERPFEEQDAARSRQALAQIGLIVVLMLILPAVLYSVAPVGPLKEGDGVFANGRQHVAFADAEPLQRLGYGSHCVLEARDQLIVLQRTTDRPDGLIRARVESRTRIEVPLCPPHVDVLLKSHQVIQKPGMLQEIRDSLARALGS